MAEEITTEQIDFADFEQIYRIDGPDKTYVGRAALLDAAGNFRGAQARFKEHVAACNDHKLKNSSRLLVEAMIELSPSAFKMTVLDTVQSDEGARREIFWINELNTVSPNGYNLFGGTDDKYSSHEETKELSRRSLKSFGKDAIKKPSASVERIIAPNCVGYRGFHNGVQKGFFGRKFELAKLRAMALHWHLYGESEYERRLPRPRKHGHEDGTDITQPGVKSHEHSDGTKVYRASHPTNTRMRSQTFEKYEDAVAFNKKLLSLDEDNIPEEFLAERRPERPPNMLYITGPKPHNRGTKTVPKGTEVGFEVRIPADASISGKFEKLCRMETKYTLAENLASAIQFRDAHIKPGLLKAA